LRAIVEGYGSSESPLTIRFAIGNGTQRLFTYEATLGILGTNKWGMLRLNSSWLGLLLLIPSSGKGLWARFLSTVLSLCPFIELTNSCFEISPSTSVGVHDAIVSLF